MRFISGTKIGPTFPDELEAAGLRGLPFSWNSTGVFEFSDRLTGEQTDRIKAVIVAHDATRTVNPLTALYDSTPLVRAAVLYLIDRFNEEAGRAVKITPAQARQGVIDKGSGVRAPLATAVAVRFGVPQAK